MLHLYFIVIFTCNYKEGTIISVNKRPVSLRPPYNKAQSVCAAGRIYLAPAGSQITGTGINIIFIYLQELNPGFKT